MLENHAMELFQLMVPTVGDPWNEIVLHGTVEATWFQFDIYFRREPEGKFIKCYDVKPFDELLPSFMKMAKLCRIAQKETREHFENEKIDSEVWTGFTFVLTREGDFNITYEYGEWQVGLNQEWHDKYLR